MSTPVVPPNAPSEASAAVDTGTGAAGTTAPTTRTADLGAGTGTASRPAPTHLDATRTSAAASPEPAGARRPVRVLVVDSRAELGGAVRSQHGLMSRLDRRRFELVAACQRGGRPRLQYEALGDVPLMDVEFGTKPRDVLGSPWRSALHDLLHAPALLLSVLQLALRVWNGQLDVIYSADAPRSLLVAHAVARLTGRPLVVHLHEAYRPGWVVHRALMRAAVVVAAAEFVRRSYVRALGPAAERIVVEHHGVEGGGGEGGPDLRRELGVDPEVVVVGATARIDPSHGQEDFVRAAARVLSYRDDVLFLVVGEETAYAARRDFLGSLRRLAGYLGCSDRLRFLGRRPDMDAVHRTLDVVVDAARHDTFGRVAIEAMAHGRPVVGTVAGALPEIVDVGGSGLLVPCRNVGALAVAIDRLIGNAELRAQMGQRARHAAATRFDLAVQTERMALLLERAAGMRRGRRPQHQHRRRVPRPAPEVGAPRSAPGPDAPAPRRRRPVTARHRGPGRAASPAAARRSRSA